MKFHAVLSNYFSSVQRNKDLNNLVRVIDKIRKAKRLNRVLISDWSNVGRVTFVMDSIASVYGLLRVTAGEMLVFKNNIRGIALNLEANSVGVLLFDNLSKVSVGDFVERTFQIMKVPVGYSLLGRVIDGLGNPIDTKSVSSAFAKYLKKIEERAPGILERQPIRENLFTGIKIVDTLLPLGRGQRQLIIGDRQTGKTTIGLDVILNQKNSLPSVKCIYVAISQRMSRVRKIVEILREKSCMGYSTIVCTTASDPVSLQYLAPYVGCTIAEFFMNLGEHSLVVYDDLSKHADSYRQMSLLLKRPAAREAYPGDIFYLHSRLLERAAKLSVKYGAGSLTAFPIVETQQGDISAYISTNLISITDGQIYLDTRLFTKGNIPAVDPTLSVSRVGASVQNKILRSLSRSIKIELAQFREVEDFARFGADVDQATLRMINRGFRIIELFKQFKHTSISTRDQILSIYSGLKGFLDVVDIKDVLRYERLVHLVFKSSSTYFPFWFMLSDKLYDSEMEFLMRSYTENFFFFSTLANKKYDIFLSKLILYNTYNFVGVVERVFGVSFDLKLTDSAAVFADRLFENVQELSGYLCNIMFFLSNFKVSQTVGRMFGLLLLYLSEFTDIVTSREIGFATSTYLFGRLFSRYTRGQKRALSLSLFKVVSLRLYSLDFIFSIFASKKAIKSTATVGISF